LSCVLATLRLVSVSQPPSVDRRARPVEASAAGDGEVDALSSRSNSSSLALCSVTASPYVLASSVDALSSVAASV